MRIAPCLLAFLLAVGFTAGDARPAAACSCGSSPSPCQAFARSPIVFVGEVLSSTRTAREFQMRLRVVRAVKGITDSTADLWSDATTNCGVSLEEGKRYVIYTSLAGGRMSVHACGFVRELEPGEPEPELPPVAGRVYGRVSRYDVDRIRAFERLDGIPSAQIALDLPAGRVTVVTDQWGRFQFANVPPGKHPLTVDAGQGLTGWHVGPAVLSEDDVCLERDITLRPAGKVSGRILTADGRPADGIYVRLVPDGPAGSELAQLVDRGKTTGPDGRFEIDGLAPDSYAVAVNPDAGDATGRQPYPAVWFGGVDRATATRIPVAEGGAIELDRPFVLPPPLPTRTFTIAVACRDGSVPPGITVQAVTARGARFAESDDLGEGVVRTLTVVRDQTYALHVTMYVPDGSGTRMRRAQPLAPVTLAAGSPGRHIGITAPATNCAEPAR